jgi:hypothetical protein
MEKLYPQRHGNFVQKRLSLCLSLLNILKKREKKHQGYALAYFALQYGAFVWGVHSSSMASNCHRKILWGHMEFIAGALDGKISLCCNSATWHAHVSRFLSLMIDCAPTWVLEADVCWD